MSMDCAMMSWMRTEAILDTFFLKEAQGSRCVFVERFPDPRLTQDARAENLRF